jgi:acyl carrier protein
VSSLQPGPIHTSAAERDVERGVATLWTAVLGVDEIGPHENFFERGGTSLKLIRLRARLCRTFSVDISVRRLFEFLTIRAMADYVETLGSSGTAAETERQPDISPHHGVV